MLLISAALWVGGALNLPGALLLGIIAASMIWSASEPESKSSYMSQLGPIAIVFLLIEVEAAVQSPNRYLGGIFSGMFFGLLFALIALALIRKVPERWHSWIGVGQVYPAYWLAYLAGVSAVSAALVSVLVYIWLNRYFQLGLDQQPPPAPLNSWPGFIGILVLFLLLGWESHQPLTNLILVEVLFGSLVGLLITWIGIQWKIPAFQTKRPIWLTGVRISALLLPTLLIWPRDLINEPILLAVAIGIAILVIGFSFLGLEFYFPEHTEEHHHHHH